LAAIIAAWFYTGGKSPYGYAGLGELAVFVFFGLVATIGTTFIQVGFIEFNAVLGGIAAGLFASAVLMVNNIRDFETDALASKKTMAVRLGKKPAIAIFLLMIWLPFLILGFFSLFYPATILGFMALLLVIPATVIVASARTAKELILVLKLTSFAALAYALSLAAGLSIVFI
jgi:1,4-dihydroxy-2-naphthoate octaprenyltransferase